jgi:hypothetical protein
MHASRQKHTAFNRRVLKAEEQISGINSGLGDFLQEMSFKDEDPLFVCLGVGHTMRATHPVGGQLWTQGSRQMTATNKVLDGMDNGRESVAFSAIVEAVAWRHALENASDPNYLRRGQRVIVHPKFLTKFATVMMTGNVGLDCGALPGKCLFICLFVGLDMDGGHDIACERIMFECQTWATTCKPTSLSSRQLRSRNVARTCGKGIDLDGRRATNCTGLFH